MKNEYQGVSRTRPRIATSSGIGAAVARRLADAGIRVVVNSARSVDAGKALAAELPDAVYVQADVSDEAQATALVAAAVEAYGRLDILVNCAGTTRFIPHDDLDAALARRLAAPLRRQRHRRLADPPPPSRTCGRTARAAS